MPMPDMMMMMPFIASDNESRPTDEASELARNSAQIKKKVSVHQGSLIL
jgi:hypothetical protein